MTAFKLYSLPFLGAALLLANGCGGNLSCGGNSMKVLPASATANHGALPPANGQGFTAMTNPCGTAATAALVNSNWAASDPSVHLSASPSTSVVATCTASLASPVTITATAVDGMMSGQASLSCN